MSRTRNGQQQQRGAVAVELGLTLPLLLAVIIVGVNFGQAMATRHTLSDAASVATRSAAIGAVTDAGTIRTMIINRMGPAAAARCANLNVNAAVVAAIAGTQRLEVNVQCNLIDGFGGALLGGAGPQSVSVQAAMPL